MHEYRVVNADGLRAVYYEGTEYPVNEIDDVVAAKLYGRTHIIEKVAAAAVAPLEVAASKSKRAEAGEK